MPGTSYTAAVSNMSVKTAIRDQRRICLFAFSIAVALIVLGLTLLHNNPYKGPEPGTTGDLHHLVYIWLGFAHLLIGAGMACGLVALLHAISGLFANRRRFWIVTAVLAAVFFAVFGFQKMYTVHYKWDRQSGFTELSVMNTEGTNLASLPMRFFVRHQIEPEVNGWLRASSLRRTQGSLAVRVGTLVPFAKPVALDCDCRGCCMEEDKNGK